MSALRHNRYSADVVRGVCECGSPLLAEYDLPQLAAESSPSIFVGRSDSLWRYHELLPVSDPNHIVSLGEGTE